MVAKAIVVSKIRRPQKGYTGSSPVSRTKLRSMYDESKNVERDIRRDARKRNQAISGI